MQTPLSVNGMTKAKATTASAIATASAGTTSGTQRKAIMAPTLLIAKFAAWRANSTPTRSGEYFSGWS